MHFHCFVAESVFCLFCRDLHAFTWRKKLWPWRKNDKSSSSPGDIYGGWTQHCDWLERWWGSFLYTRVRFWSKDDSDNRQLVIITMMTVNGDGNPKWRTCIFLTRGFPYILTDSDDLVTMMAMDFMIRKQESDVLLMIQLKMMIINSTIKIKINQIKIIINQERWVRRSEMLSQAVLG